MRHIIRSILLILAATDVRLAQTSEAADQTAPPPQTPQLHHFEEVREQGPPLSIQAALREATDRDPALAELKAQIVAVRQRAVQARSLDAPMLEGQIWQWPIGTLNPSRADMYMLSVSQEFPGRGKRTLRAGVVEKDVALFEAGVERRARELRNEITQAYVELVVARQAIAIHQNTLGLLQHVVTATQARYESGSVSQYDVLAGVVELSKLHEDLIDLDREHQLTAARLNTLMQRDPDAPIGRLDEPVDPLPLRPLLELQQAALELHPDVVAARAMQERTVAMQAEARGDLRPDLRISAGYMARPGNDNEDAWLASVGLTWPKAPWARKKVDARVAEATAEQEAGAARERAAVAQIRLAVHDAYTRASAAEQRVRLLRTTLLPQSRQAVEVSSIAYQSNRADLQAVLNEQRMLRDSQLSYYRAVTEVRQAIAELESLVGGMVTTVPVIAQQ